ncbi:hypothetical protein HID58_077252 [Brassica napus]|uniref:Uncharacterized protein n=1 Tax=Brassica napus TaxID=3708 RepID=A0ABQ7YPU2_BRANA|nr:hypothetical protein HID58_077252 [Brassica napus]
MVWGGEVYSPITTNVRKKPHTKTTMGSGRWPSYLFAEVSTPTLGSKTIPCRSSIPRIYPSTLISMIVILQSLTRKRICQSLFSTLEDLGSINQYGVFNI